MMTGDQITVPGSDPGCQEQVTAVLLCCHSSVVSPLCLSLAFTLGVPLMVVTPQLSLSPLCYPSSAVTPQLFLFSCHPSVTVSQLSPLSAPLQLSALSFLFLSCLSFIVTPSV